MKDPSSLPSTFLKISAAVARWVLWLVLAAWLLFAIAWGTLHGWIVPRIGEFRPQIEIEATRILGVPVRIGAISAYTTGLMPAVELSDVVLLDPQGREALRLPRVLAALSPRSMLALGFEQLYIDTPQLDIRRAADGRISVAGLDFSRGGSGDTTAVDWFFSQTEFVIHQGTVRWTDERRGTEPLALGNVDFTMRNWPRSHALRLDATPPPEWGERFHAAALFRQPLLSGRAGDWTTWDGQAFASFGRIDVSQLRRHADLGIDVSQGNGAIRAWADVSKGQVVGGTADIALAQVTALLGPQLEPLGLQLVTGRLGGRRLAGGFEFSTEGLRFDTREGLHWPGGNFSMNYTAPDAQTPARGEFQGDQLDLAALTQIANRLPLGTATHAQLLAYAPKGVVGKIQASWSGNAAVPEKFEAKGTVRGLEIASHAAPAPANAASAPAAGSPGIRGADVDFEMTQGGGKASVVVNAGALDLPGAFEDPLVLLDKLSAEAQWQIDGDGIAVQVHNLKFSNADAQGEAQATWHTGDARNGGRRFPGVLDLQGSLSRGVGTRVYRYLPAVIHKPVREYVREAVTQGSITSAKFKVKGDLHNMPFADPKLGEFRIAAQVKGATFAFVPRGIQPRDASPWPALTQLSGELVFDRLGMQVNEARGGLAGAPGVEITRADASIADLAHSATVMVTAQARGPLGAVLSIISSSPLGSVTNPALGKTTAGGDADYKLRLALPISNIIASKVQGSVTLAGNDVQITPGTPLLGKARGVVTFTESGFAVTGAQARMLGGDVRFEGGVRGVPGAASSTADNTVLFRGQGTLSAEGLRQAREMGLPSGLAAHASGSAAYTATLAFRRGVAEVAVASTLQGLALNLPPPFSKTADTAMPLRFENQLLRESLAPGPNGQTRLQDQLVLEVGRVAAISYVRDVSAPEPRVLRGSIAVGLAPGESAPMPDEGVVANINLTGVDIDAWEDVLSRAVGTSVSGAATARAPVAAPSGAPSAGGGNAGGVSGYLPTVLAVRAKELTVQGRKLNNLVVGGSREGSLWRANIDAKELNGYVEYRQPQGSGAGRVYARLARLTIAPGAASDVEALLDEQPSSIPALDIVVEDFDLGGKKLGRLEMDAVNRGAGAATRDGGVREWRLNKLNLTMPEAAFTATGNWAAIAATAGVPASGKRRTVMNFTLDVANSGELLARLGMPGVIRRGAGKIEGQVAWSGSPLSLDYPSMGGQFNVNMQAGQFLKADPGLARLLGVLSLQSLPRRLSLDFRDVFTEGFSFDSVRGDVKIDQGIANTNNLQMTGVNAAVFMEGKADLARETQDLTVVVVPEINAGTASLVTAVINPAVGLATFLGQMFLRRPLMQAATQEFHIDGTWIDPKIVKVPRRALPPAAAASTPAKPEGAE